MSKAQPSEERLTDEAIDLIIRLHGDPENPVSNEMVRTWRERSPAHERVWTRVAKIHGVSGRVLSDQRKAERRESLGITRRSFVIGGAVGLGAVGLGSALIPELVLQARADHITDKGEIRDILLPDGSVCTLGPSSALKLGFAADQRKIDLLMGMAFFDVAADAARPFAVTTGNITATALGTAYDVSNDAGFVTITVSNGEVEASMAASSHEGTARLVAGERLIFDTATRTVERGRLEADQIAPWRDNLVIAERETVSALVAQIGRWIPGRIVMADPFIASQRVSGIFDLSNPVRALEAVVHPAGARVRQVASFLTVISPL